MQTPSDLRILATVTGLPVITIPASDGPMVADALEIADESSIELIKCNLTMHQTDGGLLTWWDLTTWEDDDTAPLDQAVRYLESRGLLEHHPRAALKWVRPREQE